ncbi:MAG: winged helix DNA-binding domain-containing protein [Hyphomicrobiales bacterium]|nr:MAG: winged helix DNA-binding domain-containing protein [Hyphomicrobiales bacterium]
MAEMLTLRQLNRATLARQMLLERREVPIAEAVRFLGGLQGQQSNDPYVALWSRLSGFTHEALTELIVERTLARATTMRGTLHLHTAEDLVGFRALVQDYLMGSWRSGFRGRFAGQDETAVHRAGLKLFGKKPVTIGAVGKALHEKFPAAEPLALAMLMQMRETLVQVPPTRIWGNGSAPLLVRAADWLGPIEPQLSRTDLVRRYLGAFGPASINDMQVWCRLTKLSAEFKALEPELAVFEDESGRTLYDLPAAPRPDGDVPAPVRFLPFYDNVYLGYDDRRRMLRPSDAERINMFANFKPPVLVDGTIAAGYKVMRKKGAARLAIEPYHRLTKKQVREIEAEGEGFLRFMEEGAESYAVEVEAFAA